MLDVQYKRIMDLSFNIGYSRQHLIDQKNVFPFSVDPSGTYVVSSDF